MTVNWKTIDFWEVEFRCKGSEKEITVLHYKYCIFLRSYVLCYRGYFDENKTNLIKMSLEPICTTWRLC